MIIDLKSLPVAVPLVVNSTAHSNSLLQRLHTAFKELKAECSISDEDLIKACQILFEQYSKDEQAKSGSFSAMVLEKLQTKVWILAVAFCIIWRLSITLRLSLSLQLRSEISLFIPHTSRTPVRDTIFHICDPTCNLHFALEFLILSRPSHCHNDPIHTPPHQVGPNRTSLHFRLATESLRNSKLRPWCKHNRDAFSAHVFIT